MEVLHERCAGLDVHNDTVVACAMTPETKEVRIFPAVTAGLLELAARLAARSVRR